MTTKPYWRDYNDGFKYRPTLVFEGGHLSVKGTGYGDKDGEGEFGFKDDDLDFANDGSDYRLLKLARPELEAIRKHIDECLGPYSQENPRVTDNDEGQITVTLDGRELRSWIYDTDERRRDRMVLAREYVEGWCDARDASTVTNGEL